jgi:diguanylate cyclase
MMPASGTVQSCVAKPTTSADGCEADLAISSADFRNRPLWNHFSTMGSTAAGFIDEGARRSATLSIGEHQRRLKQRRQMLILQAASYAAGDIIIWVYAYAGTISLAIPAMFFLCGIGLTAFFAVLSEMNIGDRFDDHFLTSSQAAANIIMQLVFLLAAPEIGFVFLTVIFVIFGFAALRMTSREATILWALTGFGVATIFFFLKAPIALPTGTGPEWFAGAFSFVLTIGQCAYIGSFGNSMRRTLHKRTIELKIANQRIEELAQFDELTGILNRRHIMKCLNEEMARAQRSKSPCSVAIIDLDFFKRINDQFGHPAGDEALRTFAICIFANIRAIDKLGRYGGEEFLLILPDTPKDQAVQTLERLRATVSEVDWTAISGNFKLTMSAGICSVRQTDLAEDILSRVDVALYRAKDAGRNRVVAA